MQNPNKKKKTEDEELTLESLLKENIREILALLKLKELSRVFRLNKFFAAFKEDNSLMQKKIKNEFPHLEINEFNWKNYR